MNEAKFWEDIKIVEFISISLALLYAGLASLNLRMSIYLLVLFSIFDLGFFSRWIGGTRYLARIPFLLAGVLAMIFILKIFSGKLKIRGNDRAVILTLKFIFLLTCLAVLSCLYNSESLVLGLFELRYFYILVIFIISFSYYLPRFATINNFILFLVIIGLLQIPFTVLQYIMVQGMDIRLSQSALDMVSGTFSSYPSLVFLQCIAIAGILEYHLSFKRPLLKINNYLVTGLLIVPLLLSYSRSAIGFVLLTIIFVFSTDMIKNMNNLDKILKRSIILLFICSISLLAFLQFFYKVHQFTQQLNINYVVDYLMREPKGIQEYQAGAHAVMGRGRAITEATNLVSDNFFTFLLGRGSGSSTEASFIGMKGKYFYEYGPMAGIGRTQISKTIVELGFLGLFIIGFFFLRLFLSKKVAENLRENTLINNMFLHTMFILFLAALYTPILASEISLLIISFLIAIKFRVMGGKCACMTFHSSS